MAIFASALVFVIMLIIVVDVLSRLLFNHPFAGVAEIVSMMIIIFTFLVLPHVTARNGHVRTTMLYDKVGRNGKLVIDLIASILGVLVYAFIIRASWKGFMNAINIGEAEIAGFVRETNPLFRKYVRPLYLRIILYTAKYRGRLSYLPGTLITALQRLRRPAKLFTSSPEHAR